LLRQGLTLCHTVRRYSQTEVGIPNCRKRVVVSTTDAASSKDESTEKIDAEIAAEYAVAENDEKIAGALKAQSEKTWGKNDYPEKLELAMPARWRFG
jgi:hypothetical protein